MQFKRYARPFAAAAIVLPVLAACGNGGDNNDPMTRSTQFGQVTGVVDAGNSGTLSWKGIPYAKAPADPDAWATKSARSFASACVQYGRIYGPGANLARTGNPNEAALGVTWPAWPRKVICDASLIAKAISVE